MSDLHDALREAAVGAPELRPVATETKRPPETAPKKGNPLLLVGLAAIAVVVAGVVLSFKDAAVYAKTVDQLMAEKDRFTGRAVRAEGNLVKGSLTHQESPCEYRFRIAEKGAEIPVRYAGCVVPDTFRDMPGMDVRVTVEGKLTTEGAFEATQVMAKCPSKYEMKDRARSGEAAPHQPVAGEASP